MTIPIVLKRSLKIVGILLAVLIAAAVAVPYFFKDKIIAKVKEAVNKDLSAKVDFKDVDISLFRHFPKISVKLTELDVVGNAAPFDGVRLLRTEGLDLALNFWSVWRGGNPYEVTSIYLDKPFINIVALADGSANYEVTKPKPPSEPTDFKLSLEHYEANNATFIYDDRALNFYLKLAAMNHSGSGDLTADVYDLDTKTTADSTTMSYGGMTYLSNAKAVLSTIINADMKNRKFTFKNTDAKVNELKMNLDGFVQMKGVDKVMDLTFKAPSNNFKDFLSIIPAAYTANYSDVKASGAFNFDGFVRGTYNVKTPQYPAFKINLGVQNAAFQYPKLPMGGSDINTDLTVELPSSDFDALKIDVPRFHMKLGNNPFDAVLHLRTPESDPNVDLQAKGTLNLGELTKVLPLESVQNLSGVINADVTIKTLMSYIEKKMYDKVNMNGALTVNNMTAQPKGYPSVFVQNLAMKFTPNSVDVGNFTAKLGKSDIQAAGAIDNILAYFSTNRTMTGKLNFSSNTFDANEWLTPKSATATTVSTGKNPKNVASATAARPFDRFNFTIDGKIDRLLYSNYDIRGTAMAGNFTSNLFKINNFKTQIGNSDIAGSGTLTGIFDWLFDNKTLGGNLILNSNMMDLNQFMTATPKPTTEAKTVTNVATEPIQVPKNVDVNIAAKMGRVIYTNMDLRDLTGRLVVENQEVRIEDATANSLGGRIGVKGGYNTQVAAKPTFKLNMNLAAVDFKQSFNTFNTFQKLAPIGQYITGKFNTTIDIDGELGKDMMPNLSTLNLSGFLQTLQGVLSGFKPLSDIADKLNISELKNLDLKESKNWLEVKNGFVTVKEFDKMVGKDIKLTIGGAHSLTNEMNYSVKARVPRKRLESNAVGATAGAAFNNIVTEAAKLGLNIKNSEFVNVQFGITGSMLQPKISMKVLAGDGQTVQDAAVATVNAAVDKAKDSIMTKANEKIDEAKVKAKQAADKALDSVTNVANRKIEEAKQKAIDEAKKRVGDELGKKTGSIADSLAKKAGVDQKAKDELQKAKDKLDQFNPFKKKPKDGGN